MEHGSIRYEAPGCPQEPICLLLLTQTSVGMLHPGVTPHAWRIICPDPMHQTSTEGTGEKEMSIRGKLWVGHHPSLWHLVEVAWPDGAWASPDARALFLAKPKSGMH